MYRHRREGAVGTVGPDFEPGPVYVGDDARVIVTYRVHGRIAEQQAMPIARFCAWPGAMRDVEIIDVRLVVPDALAAFGKGRDGRLECSVWDARYAGQALLRRDVLRDYADSTPEGRRFAASLKASPGDVHPWPRPPDGAVVSAGTVTEVLNGEAILPSTVGDPPSWWYVFDWGPPFTYIAGSSLPPAEGQQRRWQIKSAITAAVSDDAYFRSKPGLDGSRERQSELLEDAAGVGYRGRSLSKGAKKERTLQRRTRRRHLEDMALTLAEYSGLSMGSLFELNLIQWGSVPWLLELETSAKSAQVFAPQRRHGRRSKYWIADPTGEAAAAFATATSLPLAALSYGVEGMSFARPFADVDAARGDPSYETAGQVVLDRWLAAGMTERQSIVLLNVQAGWTAEQIHKVLNIARPTVAAHLAAARRVLERISEID